MAFSRLSPLITARGIFHQEHGHAFNRLQNPLWINMSKTFFCTSSKFQQVPTPQKSQPNPTLSSLVKASMTTTTKTSAVTKSQILSLSTLSEKPSWTTTVKPYVDLMRLSKPIGTWLLYWPCAWSISMAAFSSVAPLGTTIYNLVLFGTGAIVMRGAGCTINDLWDQDIDKKVERTQVRPLASNTITTPKAIAFLGAQLSIGLAVLTQLNWYSIFLGASSMAVVVLYPLAKRVTYWPQLVLGLAFNWGALLGSSAMLGACNWQVSLPLYLGSICWTLVYDTIYAHQDITDDLKAGVKSTAILFEPNTKPILSAFSTVFVSSLAYCGYMNEQTLPFYLISVLGSAVHLAWQIKTVNLKDRADCWAKFCSNRNLGYIVSGGILLDYALKLFV